MAIAYHPIEPSTPTTAIDFSSSISKVLTELRKRFLSSGGTFVGRLMEVDDDALIYYGDVFQKYCDTLKFSVYKGHSQSYLRL